jgi:hypothetical protein
MKRIAGFMVLILLLCVPFSDVSAQKSRREARRDSVRQLRDTLNLYYLHNKALYQLATREKILADTSLNYFQMYQPATRTDYFPTADNLGKVPQPIFFKPDSTIGFKSGMEGYRLYTFNKHNIRYLLTRRPYTEINYFLGSAPGANTNIRGEQLFSILHTQRVAVNTHAGIEFRLISGAGFYQRQWAKHSNLRFFITHFTKNNRYILAAHVNWNALNAEENGGITPYADFSKGGYYQTDPQGNLTGNFITVGLKQNYPVGLTGAKNSSRIFNVHYFHALNFGTKTVQDSGKTINAPPLFRLSHTLDFEQQTHRYTDYSQPTYYTTYYFVTDTTRYRLRTRELSNRIEAALFPFRKKGRNDQLAVGADLSYIDAWQDTITKSYVNTSVYGRLKYSLDSLKFIEIQSTWFASGYNRNDLHIQGLLNVGFRDKKKRPLVNLTAIAAFRLTEPAFTQRFMYSRNFRWDNPFGKIRTLQAGTEALFGRWNLVLGAGADWIGNLVYYDTTGIVKQWNKEALIFRVYVRQHQKFAKHFHWENQIMYQGKNDAPVRFPALTVRSSFYYENAVFRKKLLLRAGFDLFYCTSFRAYAWVPATRQWALQERTFSGNYPYLDVYVSAKIKRFRFFVKAAHVNQGFPNTPYTLSSGMPMPDRNFVLGINWALVN